MPHMPIVTPETVQVETITVNDTPCGPATGLRFSDTGGLTQFGAFVEILPPGSRSSLCHWHLNEDEFIYMLNGEVTVHEGGTRSLLLPGHAACFKAGVPAGHYLQNHGNADASYLVVGSRHVDEVVTYPDHDRVLYAVGEVRRFTTLDGTEGVESAYLLPGA
jgi:uncharacterized cupin superfamily protein